jgi:hypothetical protein
MVGVRTGKPGCRTPVTPITINQLWILGRHTEKPVPENKANTMISWKNGSRSGPISTPVLVRTSRSGSRMMSRRRAKGPPDPLLDKNRPTKEGWRHWVEWGRNYAPPGLPKDDRSEQPSQEEPSQEEQKDNRGFRGKSFPGRTAPRVAAAGGGAGGGGGSSGSSSPGDRRGVGRSQSRSPLESVAGTAEPGMPVASVAVPGGASMDELPEGITEADLDEDRRARATAEIVAGCDPAFVAVLRRWSIMETHIATLAEGGYTIPRTLECS